LPLTRRFRADRPAAIRPLKESVPSFLRCEYPDVRARSARTIEQDSGAQQAVEKALKCHCEERSDAVIQINYQCLPAKDREKQKNLDCFVGLRPPRNDKDINPRFQQPASPLKIQS
jgi:hypothetical protein